MRRREREREGESEDGCYGRRVTKLNDKKLEQVMRRLEAGGAKL